MGYLNCSGLAVNSIDTDHKKNSFLYFNTKFFNSRWTIGAFLFRFQEQKVLN